MPPSAGSRPVLDDPRAHPGKAGSRRPTRAALCPVPSASGHFVMSKARICVQYTPMQSRDAYAADPGFRLGRVLTDVLGVNTAAALQVDSRGSPCQPHRVLPTPATTNLVRRHVEGALLSGVRPITVSGCLARQMGNPDPPRSRSRFCTDDQSDRRCVRGKVRRSVRCTIIWKAVKAQILASMVGAAPRGP
jgi:hypothetical protein